MGRLFLLASFLAFSAGSAMADGPKERAAILSIDLGKGVQEFVRAKASAQIALGLTAAGYDVIPPEQTAKQLTGDLATCRSGTCLGPVAKAVGANVLVSASISRKLDSQIIVMQLLEPSGEVDADIHEVCDLCGQEELEERIGVAASALRAKAVAALAKRASETPTHTPTPPAANGGTLKVAVIPGIAVNLDTARVDAISQDLADALSSELEVAATGGLEVRRQLPPDGVPPDCVTTPACTADVAKRTGASQLLFVVMVDSGSGGSIQIDTTWVEPSSGKNASRPAVDLTSPSEAKAKFSSAARSLLPDAPVRAKGNQGGGGGGMTTPAMTEGVPRHFTTPAKIALAVGVVGLGFGIAMGVKTKSHYESCDNDPNNCSESERSTIRNFGITADVGFIVATGGVIAAAVLYMTSAEAPHFVVSPTPNGAAVSAFGRF